MPGPHGLVRTRAHAASRLRSRASANRRNRRSYMPARAVSKEGPPHPSARLPSSLALPHGRRPHRQHGPASHPCRLHRPSAAGRSRLTHAHYDGGLQRAVVLSSPAPGPTISSEAEWSQADEDSVTRARVTLTRLTAPSGSPSGPRSGPRSAHHPT